MITNSLRSSSLTNPYCWQNSTSFYDQLYESIRLLSLNLTWLIVLLILMISRGDKAIFYCSLSLASYFCNSLSCLLRWYCITLLILSSNAVRSLNCLQTSSSRSSLRLQQLLRKRGSSCGRCARVVSLDMKAGMSRLRQVWQMFLQLLSKVEQIFFLLKWRASVQLMLRFFMSAMLGSLQLYFFQKKLQLRQEQTMRRMLLRLREWVIACSLRRICSQYFPNCQDILQKYIIQLLIDYSSVLFWLIRSPSEIDCRHSYRQCILRFMKAVDRMQWFILLLIRLTYDFYWKRLPRLLSKQRCIQLTDCIGTDQVDLSRDLRQLVLNVWSYSASSRTVLAMSQGLVGTQFSRLNLTSSMDLVSMKSCWGTFTSSPFTYCMNCSWILMISLKSSFQKQIYILRMRKSMRLPCSSLLFLTLRSVLSILESSRQNSLKVVILATHCLYLWRKSMLLVTDSISASNIQLVRQMDADSVRVSIFLMRNWMTQLWGSFSSPSMVISWREKRMEMTWGEKKLAQFIIQNSIKIQINQHGQQYKNYNSARYSKTCFILCMFFEGIGLLDWQSELQLMIYFHQQNRKNKMSLAKRRHSYLKKDSTNSDSTNFGSSAKSSKLIEVQRIHSPRLSDHLYPQKVQQARSPSKLNPFDEQPEGRQIVKEDPFLKAKLKFLMARTNKVNKKVGVLYNQLNAQQFEDQTFTTLKKQKEQEEKKQMNSLAFFTDRIRKANK